MSLFNQTMQPDAAVNRIRATGLVVLVALSTAFAGLVATLVALWVAYGSMNLHRAILGRGLLTMAAVLLICRFAASRAKRSGIARPPLLTGAGALFGYLLDPQTWGARTALTQLWREPGVLTLLGDLLLWMLAAGLGAWWGASDTRGAAVATTPYG